MGKRSPYNIFIKMREAFQSNSQTHQPLILNASEKETIEDILSKGSVGQIIIAQEVKFMGDEYKDINNAFVATGNANLRTGQIVNSFHQAQTQLAAKDDLSEEKKSEIRQQLNALEEELKKETIDRDKFLGIWDWIKGNADWLVPTLKTTVAEGLKRCFGVA
jgi:hypothetical protein